MMRLPASVGILHEIPHRTRLHSFSSPFPITSGIAGNALEDRYTLTFLKKNSGPASLLKKTIQSAAGTKDKDAFRGIFFWYPVMECKPVDHLWIKIMIVWVRRRKKTAR